MLHEGRIADREGDVIGTSSARTLPGAASEELVARARRGDAAAFDSLARSHIDRSFRLALAILRSETNARDAVQDAYLQAWRQLPGLRDTSSRPHSSPNATKAEVVGKIIYLRQHYHFGPHKIVMYLKRYHDIQISPSGVWRILKRLDMSRLPSSQRYRRHQDRWKRYEKPCPVTGCRSTLNSLPR